MTFAAWSFQRAYYAWTVRPDVVHLQYTYSDFDQYSLSWLPNTVRVLTIHNVFPVATHSELNKNHQVLQRVYSACDGLIVHTESNKRELLNNFALEESRVRVIAHGALPPDDAVPSDVALAQLGLESNCRYLLVFGGLRASKGIDIAIEAFALLVVSDENLRLIIAGGVCADSDLQQLQQQADKQAEDDRQAQEELESAFEEIEETYDVDLSSNTAFAKKTRADFIEYVRKIAPKNKEGEVQSFPDMLSAFEEYQERSKRSAPASRAKELASRSMSRSSDATTAPAATGKSWKDVERMFSKLSS